ncbi:MAG: IS110 family transposase [Nitrospirota bacterium]
MVEISIIGVDLAKNSFQVHGASVDGTVVFRKKLSRGRVLKFLAVQPRCTVAMEACASAHHWGREFGRLGHDVRLIAPIYVKPFVKRQKNDAADAEAICEAAQRPTMRFVAVKSEDKQSSAMIFKTRDLLVRQKTRTINALRAHLAEFGVIAPKGPAHLGRLVSQVRAPETGLLEPVRTLCLMLIDLVRKLIEQIRVLDGEIKTRSRNDDVAKRLMTIPGVGPVIATALEALAPPAETFKRGRDFAAWMGLTPRQRSTGGKPRLGKISKMGQRDLRRLLIIGASAVVRWAAKRGAPEGSWLARMLVRKPRMLIVVALANKIARVAWALMAHGGIYRVPVCAA